MVGLILAAAIAASPVNPDYLPEQLGAGSDGAGTLVTANASANAKGAYVSLGTITGPWIEFFLEATAPSSTNNRYQVYLSLDGGSTDIVAGWQVHVGNNFAPQRILFPLNVPAGATVHAAVRCHSGSSQTIRLSLTGRVSADAGNKPGFTVCEPLMTVSTANTMPSSTTVTVANSGVTGTFTTLVANLAHTYGAFLLTMDTSAALTNTQNGKMLLAKGAASSEVVIGARTFHTENSANSQAYNHHLVEAEVAAGERLSLRLYAATAGDAPTIGLFGFR